MSDDHPYQPRPDLLLRVREQAERGFFTDPDDALEAALDLVDDQPDPFENLDEAQVAHIRALIQEGVDDIEAGRVVDAEVVFREMREERERRAQAAERGAA